MNRLMSFGLIALKNAVNATIVALAPILSDHEHFNFYSREGWLHIGYLVLGAVGGRELLVWGPVVLQWSKTNADPLQAKIAKAQETQEVADKAAEAVIEEATKHVPADKHGP